MEHLPSIIHDFECTLLQLYAFILSPFVAIVWDFFVHYLFNC